MRRAVTRECAGGRPHRRKQWFQKTVLTRRGAEHRVCARSPIFRSKGMGIRVAGKALPSEALLLPLRESFWQILGKGKRYMGCGLPALVVLTIVLPGSIMRHLSLSGGVWDQRTACDNISLLLKIFQLLTC